ncbi:hypothetical protein D3C76_1279000 [compost metagenome]
MAVCGVGAAVAAASSPFMPAMALTASPKLNCAKTGLAARVRSDASAKPREIFIQTSSCVMKNARLTGAKLPI